MASPAVGPFGTCPFGRLPDYSPYVNLPFSVGVSLISSFLYPDWDEHIRGIATLTSTETRFFFHCLHGPPSYCRRYLQTSPQSEIHLQFSVLNYQEKFNGTPKRPQLDAWAFQRGQYVQFHVTHVANAMQGVRRTGPSSEVNFISLGYLRDSIWARLPLSVTLESSEGRMHAWA